MGGEVGEESSLCALSFNLLPLFICCSREAEHMGGGGGTCFPHWLRHSVSRLLGEEEGGREAGRQRRVLET